MVFKGVKGGKQKHKKVMKGRGKMEVFDDTAGVYQVKRLRLSIQLKRIKGCHGMQTLLHWSHNSLNLICCPSLAPGPHLCSSPPPSPSFPFYHTILFSFLCLCHS